MGTRALGSSCSFRLFPSQSQLHSLALRRFSTALWVPPKGPQFPSWEPWPPLLSPFQALNWPPFSRKLSPAFPSRLACWRVCPPWIILDRVSIYPVPVDPEGLALSQHSVSVGQKKPSVYEATNGPSCVGKIGRPSRVWKQREDFE